MDKTVVVGGNVQGDITSCKIENQLIRTDKKSVFSLQELNTYASYDVCSRKIIDKYTVPSFTKNTFLLGGAILFLLFLIIVSSCNSTDFPY